MKKYNYVLFLLLTFSSLQAQKEYEKYFREISLAIDARQYFITRDTVQNEGDFFLQFDYEDENPVVEFLFQLRQPSQVERIALLAANDYSVLDSLRFINKEQYRLKIRFQELTQSNFLRLTLQIYLIKRAEPYLLDLNLFPTTRTRVVLPAQERELFIGEEQVFRLETDNLANIRTTNRWINEPGINYRITKNQGNLRLHLLPNRLGIFPLYIPLNTRKPYLDSLGQLHYQIYLDPVEFTVKPAKLVFLSVDPRETTLRPLAKREAIQLEMEYESGLGLQKTYRLEAQEEPGGNLVAEIFTRQLLANGKVLCWLRLYDFHRRSDGYLYIKDGDQPVYLTNFDILPETSIETISILRKGEDWKANANIYPGEDIEIRLEGTALQRANIAFEGLTRVQKDTLAAGENQLVFSAHVPMEITQRRVQIYNHGQATSQSLRVNEFSRPRQFDFIRVQYGDQLKRAHEIDKLEFVPESLDDIILEFDNNQIDSGLLYGKQYLKISIEIRNQRNQLEDTREINNVVVCPGLKSPRFKFYDSGDCQQTDININSYLRRKIFDLETWSTIRIKIEHDRTRHGNQGVSQTLEFVLHQKMTFDIDVSFPAGLIVKRLDEPGFGSLGGISMAMMAQFSFYANQKIAKAKPYKFGIGFLAFNAFNFDDNSGNRDVGLVALASFYPIKTAYSSRLSFPLYVGSGYFLSDEQFFLLLGPGIRVRL